MPRRHLSRQYRFADGLRPGPGFGVAGEGHGCDLTRLMTAYASSLQNRPNIGELDLRAKGKSGEENQQRGSDQKSHVLDDIVREAIRRP
jgi:hypothetical protein